MLPIFIKFKGLYVPTNLSDNNLRHCGFKSHKILFLEIHELLYLVSKDVHSTYPVSTRGYFDLKNSGYNVLPCTMPPPTDLSFEDLLKAVEVLDFRDLHSSKALKKFSKEELGEIKKMENKLKEFELDRMKNSESFNESFNVNLNDNVNDNVKTVSNKPCEYKVYRRTKNFKRSDEPIGRLRFIDKAQRVCDVVEESTNSNNSIGEMEMICLLSEDDFVFLDVYKLESLSLSLDPRLRKRPSN